MANRRRARPSTARAGERGVAVSGDVVGSLIVTGADVSVELKVGPEHGALLEQVALLQRPRIRKRRPTPTPGPFANHLDRTSETDEIVAAPAAQPVNVHGEAGVGKTYVLCDVASRMAGDGGGRDVVFLFARGDSRDDLLHAIFDELYDSTPPIRPSAAQAVRLLRRRRPLLLLDSLALERDEAQALLLSLTSAAVVVSSRSRVLWEGRALAIAGLGREDAAALIEQELGRPLEPDEAAAAEWAWRTLEGHPLRLRQAAALARESGARLSAPADGVVAEAVDSLSRDERLLLAVLVQLGGIDIGLERLAHRAGRLKETVELGHAIDSALAWSNRWDAWHEVLTRVLDAARETGDRSSEGLGTVSVPVLIVGIVAALLLSGGGTAAAFALSGGGGDAPHSTSDVDTTAVLAIRIDGKGTGFVTIGPTDVVCWDDCRRDLDLGTEVRLRPTAAKGSRFTGWRDCPRVDAAACRVTLTEDVSLTALFALREQETRALRVTARNGTVTSDPSGIDCPGKCRHRFPVGQTLTLRATPDPGFVFARWMRCPDSRRARCRVSIDQDRAIDAVFRRTGKPTYMLTVKVVGPDGKAIGGTVTSAAREITCADTCTHRFTEGKIVELTATADAGFAFDSWEKCPQPTDTRCAVKLHGDLTVTAHFKAAPRAGYMLFVRIQGPKGRDSGTVRSRPGGISCGLRCNHLFTNPQVVLTASGPGFVFDRWVGCLRPRGSTCSLSLGKPTTRVLAVFRDPRLALRVKGGTISSRSPDVTCSQECVKSLPLGTRITLTATPSDGNYEFVNVTWGGACKGTPETKTTCTITVDGDVSVSAAITTSN